MFDFGHFGDRVGDVDEVLGGIAPGDHDVDMVGALLDGVNDL